MHTVRQWLEMSVRELRDAVDEAYVFTDGHQRRLQLFAAGAVALRGRHSALHVRPVSEQ